MCGGRRQEVVKEAEIMNVGVELMEDKVEELKMD